MYVNFFRSINVNSFKVFSVANVTTRPLCNIKEEIGGAPIVSINPRLLM
jgi:hypothetical protein